MANGIQHWLIHPTQNSRCAIIAEVGQGHDGSLGMAHAFIDAVASAGADAIKFQTHIANEESSPAEQWRRQFSLQDNTRLDYWRRMEFTAEQWQQLKNHADKAGIIFLSSPFSIKAIELLENINIPVWKIASGEITNFPFLEKILLTNKPIILSTGLSPMDEIGEAVKFVRKGKNSLALLQCTSRYPCPSEYIGLNVIDVFRDKFGCAVGLSDHSGKIFSGLAAATKNIQLLEVHVTLSREMFGPDVIASITTSELRTVVNGVREIETMNANPVDKNEIDPEAKPLRKIFMKSIFTRTDIKQGELITESHLTTKKPGTGIPANQVSKILGKKATRNVCANSILSTEDFS